MPRLNNIRPSKAMKLLEEYGWELVNIKGTHYTYSKIIKGVVQFCQVIANYKTIHWKNVKIMIEKSGIPEEIWIKGCFFSNY